MSETLTCDVLVAGSGAGGLAAAVTAHHLGLDVIVAEKAPLFGGTTARSGGWLWIPGNPLERAAGIEDSLEDAYRYLEHEAGNAFDSERVMAFLRAGPEMVDFFRRHTALDFVLGPHFSDYHPDAPGARPGGRSICAAPFDGSALGPELARLRPPLDEITLFGMMIGSGPELQHFFQATRSPRSALYVARLLARFARDRLLYGRALRLTNGNALAARLAKSAFDRGIPIWTDAPLRELVVEGGRITGALVERQGSVVRVHTRRGVVLACGGFPHDRARRARLFPHAPDGEAHFSPAPEENTGDGLKLAEAVGAAVVEELPNAAA
jgi:succinate dehydrogenase/fumarate reductase flavoprotein subunit